MGLDPSTVRRAFQRHFGQSFLQYARAQRLRGGVRTLIKGDAVIEAQLDAGFNSASGFRGAFARLFGHAPQQMRGDALVLADWIETPLGGMIVIADDAALHLLEFHDRKALARQVQRLSAAVGGRIGLGRTAISDRTEAQLQAFMNGQQPRFDLLLETGGTPFQRRVWQQLQQIPAGQTRSYARLAEEIDRPSAVRAVANANANNRIAIVVPCHRVIGADGSLTGYAGGLWRKEKLIGIERSYEK